MAMQIIQWIVAAGTTIFVALVGLFQWRTAQQKAVLDLFERRHAIYEVVRRAVGIIRSSSPNFDQGRETEFLEAKERAYFFFGDDVKNYLEQLWEDIKQVRNADAELQGLVAPDYRIKIVEKRRAALNRIDNFDTTGLPLLARYMRFSQTVPTNLRSRIGW
jgi:hypothetical protein